MIVLHWQLIHWLKELSLASRVAIFSCLGHLFLLFALFVVYKGNGVYNVIISSTMINTDAKIVYMPLHRSIKQSVSKSTSACVSSATSSSCTGQKAQTKIDNGQSTTIVMRKNPKSAPVAQKKSKIEKIKAKKSAAKILEPKKVIEEKKEIPKMETPKPEVKSKDAEPIKPTQEIKEDPKLEMQKITAAENAVATNVDQTAENIVYVGQAEMEALQLQEYIQNEMAAHWTPPAGIRSDAQCIVKISVSHDGKNNQIVLEQPSKILLFDSAARRAAAQLQPPQWAYGKEIFITFKP